MKQLVLFLHVLLYLLTANGQGALFPLRRIDGIALMDNSLLSDDFSKYPYADITVIVRHADHLSQASFVKGHFNRTQYFYLALDLQSEANKQTIPLFLFQRGKDNTYATSSIEDRTILKKYLYNPADKKTLVALLTTNINVKNKALSFLNTIAEPVGQIITNPSNLITLESAKQTYTFFSTLLKQAAEEQKYNSTVMFDVFKNEYMRINNYSIYIIAPSKAVLPDKHKLILAKDGSGSLLLMENGQEYRDFPYLIVLQTLNNYYNLNDNIPSMRIQRYGCTGITESDTRFFDSVLTVNKSNISSQQNFAESVLLDYLKIISVLEKAARVKDDVSMYAAYEAIYQFEDARRKAKGIEKTLYSDKSGYYQPRIAEMEDNIQQYFSRLPYYGDLKRLGEMNKSTGLILNSKLGEYHYSVEKLNSQQFMRQNLILIQATQKLLDIEQELFNKHFKK